jgi:hypothetical protein
VLGARDLPAGVGGCAGGRGRPPGGVPGVVRRIRGGALRLAGATLPLAFLLSLGGKGTAHAMIDRLTTMSIEDTPAKLAQGAPRPLSSLARALHSVAVESPVQARPGPSPLCGRRSDRVIRPCGSAPARFNGQATSGGSAATRHEQTSTGREAWFKSRLVEGCRVRAATGRIAGEGGKCGRRRALGRKVIRLRTGSVG